MRRRAAPAPARQVNHRIAQLAQQRVMKHCLFYLVMYAVLLGLLSLGYACYLYVSMPSPLSILPTSPLRSPLAGRLRATGLGDRQWARRGVPAPVPFHLRRPLHEREP